MTWIIPAQQVAVHTDYDVIVLRQHVRELARNLGLGLIQQAKIATAVTTIARGFLELQRDMTFVLSTTADRVRPSFKIECDTPLNTGQSDPSQFAEVLRLEQTRLLVDELDLTLQCGVAQMTLRVWLGAASQ
jgi:hypothetical protein